MFEGDKRTLSRLKSRKVSKDKRGRLKDYAVSSGRGAFLGASADLLSPYSGKKSLLFPLIGAGALAGAGYEAYKGSKMNKTAALENFYLLKIAALPKRRNRPSYPKVKDRYGQLIESFTHIPMTPENAHFYPEFLEQRNQAFTDMKRRPGFNIANSKFDDYRQLADEHNRIQSQIYNKLNTPSPLAPEHLREISRDVEEFNRRASFNQGSPIMKSPLNDMYMGRVQDQVKYYNPTEVAKRKAELEANVKSIIESNAANREKDRLSVEENNRLAREQKERLKQERFEAQEERIRQQEQAERSARRRREKREQAKSDAQFRRRQERMDREFEKQRKQLDEMYEAERLREQARRAERNRRMNLEGNKPKSYSPPTVRVRTTGGGGGARSTSRLNTLGKLGLGALGVGALYGGLNYLQNRSPKRRRR